MILEQIRENFLNNINNKPLIKKLKKRLDIEPMNYMQNVIFPDYTPMVKIPYPFYLPTRLYKQKLKITKYTNSDGKLNFNFNIENNNIPNHFKMYRLVSGCLTVKGTSNGYISLGSNYHDTCYDIKECWLSRKYPVKDGARIIYTPYSPECFNFKMHHIPSTNSEFFHCFIQSTIQTPITIKIIRNFEFVPEKKLAKYYYDSESETSQSESDEEPSKYPQEEYQPYNPIKNNPSFPLEQVKIPISILNPTIYPLPINSTSISQAKPENNDSDVRNIVDNLLNIKNNPKLSDDKITPLIIQPVIEKPIIIPQNKPINNPSANPAKDIFFHDRRDIDIVTGEPVGDEEKDEYFIPDKIPEKKPNPITQVIPSNTPQNELDRMIAKYKNNQNKPPSEIITSDTPDSEFQRIMDKSNNRPKNTPKPREPDPMEKEYQRVRDRFNKPKNTGKGGRAWDSYAIGQPKNVSIIDRDKISAGVKTAAGIGLSLITGMGGK